MRIQREDKFAAESLAATLRAVRAKRRRRTRAQRLAGSALAVAAGLLFWRSQSPPDGPVSAGGPVREVAEAPPVGTSPPPPHPQTTVRVFRTADRVGDTAMFKVVSTAEIDPEVLPIDDRQLAEILAGRSYGLLTRADGRRQLWLPES